MANSNSIQKTPKLKPDQDYGNLRTQGLQYVQELGSALWTDFNEHDPGVTILEALCYSLTELGYRNGLPMKDLLTDATGKIPSSQTFFTAKNILTQSPLTIDDYRKMLIDMAGIQNAFLFSRSHYRDGQRVVPAGEIGLFADCKADQLTYTQTPHPVYLRGLYKVLLDLDDDPQLGDLNNGTISCQVLVSGSNPVGTATLDIVFPVLADADPAWLTLPTDTTLTVNMPVAFSGDGLTLAVSVTGNGNSYTIPGTVAVGLQPAGTTLGVAAIQAFFADAGFVKNILLLYLAKIGKTHGILQAAVRKLNCHRNLCEDFESVTIIRDEEIAFCFDVDVSPDADIDEVEAYVLFTIEQYLNPPVNFYLLSEMLDKGYSVDEIFEGPRLTHGFIDTGELDDATLRTEIHASQLIADIMDLVVDGSPLVLAVRNFRMTAYDDQENPIAGQTGEPWCLKVARWRKPVLSTTKSKITLYKNQFPFLADPQEANATLEWLEAVNAREKLSGQADDLPVPTGTWFPLDKYSTVEYLFPVTYGIGKAGLPSTVTDGRKAQARQLKSYLLFYDQLLADFFAQLKNAPALFSTDATVQTYYARFLDTIPDGDALYKTGGGNNLLKTLLAGQDSTVAGPTPWEQLYEPTETFTDRRNRFLDHLMARFAESFSDYVFLMYSLDYTTQQETRIDPTDLIKSKREFLIDYPRLSYFRARAFDYFPQHPDLTPDTTKYWDTDNVSGLEQKLCLLGGMADPPGGTVKSYFRRFLYCAGQAMIIPAPADPGQFQFQWTDAQGNTVTSVATYATQADALQAVPGFLDDAFDPANYTVVQTGAVWQFEITDSQGNILAVSNTFPDSATAGNILQQFLSKLGATCDQEGMHLIEHILLRPRNNSFALAPVCLDPQCEFCGEEDPYSFRISIVLPYWPAHFENMAFRDYFEQLARAEAPAHCMIRICWIDNQSMFQFETAYKAWITALANYAANPLDAPAVAALQTANDSFLAILYNLHSEYPVATLHDCDDSKETNPVMLGRTILGTF